ncbi:Carbohydrate-binding WSC [Cordyceps fumosorosea ARSEF 2679]|uniref:Carbohydrate-binding WSC n=1 Tax=Cordyceps fumosorosea (strain ARSEF 2679) TaxID=1081104 RepID=A0A162MS64_CORFA|nr:Carbohydrate-binding WSC [Cordyceps fumosorosea ARSEF 2679]OAA66090.1 Carbohydrate-binding WSC [Cordyceps fumosorosea ARSEF 2679]
MTKSLALALLGLAGLAASQSPTPTPTPTPTPSPTPPPAPTHKSALGGYNLQSCWAEGSVRALSGAFTADDAMTLEKCMAFCHGYNYWGTEYGRECYCGNSLGAGSAAVPIDQCNMVCGGDPSEYCGAGNRLELYSTTVSITTPTGTLAHKPTIAPYTMVGCWAEGATNRALNNGGTSSPSMTNEKCADFCKAYRYFGTEYGSECHCGSYLADDSKAAPLADCNMLCAGDQFEYCGASNRLELYMNPNIAGGAPEQPPAAGDFSLVGCQTEGNNTRALAGASTAADNMTNEVCATFCKDYEYFGTEYGRECYCGNALATSSAASPKTDCGMLCGGSNVQYCGGSNQNVAIDLESFANHAGRSTVTTEDVLLLARKNPDLQRLMQGYVDERKAARGQHRPAAASRGRGRGGRRGPRGGATRLSGR